MLPDHGRRHIEAHVLGVDAFGQYRGQHVEQSSRTQIHRTDAGWLGSLGKASILIDSLTVIQVKKSPQCTPERELLWAAGQRKNPACFQSSEERRVGTEWVRTCR